MSNEPLDTAFMFEAELQEWEWRRKGRWERLTGWPLRLWWRFWLGRVQGLFDRFRP